MAIVFNYRKEKGPKGVPIKRPVVTAKLSGPARSGISHFFYLDSGADYTVIPYSLGLFLGLSGEGKSIQEVHGINGVVGVIYSTIQITIGEITFPATVAWAQLEHVPMLLGRSDVFDRFDITFRQNEWMIVFEPK